MIFPKSGLRMMFGHPSQRDESSCHLVMYKGCSITRMRRSITPPPTGAEYSRPMPLTDWHRNPITGGLVSGPILLPCSSHGRSCAIKSLSSGIPKSCTSASYRKPPMLPQSRMLISAGSALIPRAARSPSARFRASTPSPVNESRANQSTPGPFPSRTGSASLHTGHVSNRRPSSSCFSTGPSCPHWEIEQMWIRSCAEASTIGAPTSAGNVLSTNPRPGSVRGIVDLPEPGGPKMPKASLCSGTSQRSSAPVGVADTPLSVVTFPTFFLLFSHVGTPRYAGGLRLNLFLLSDLRARLRPRLARRVVHRADLVRTACDELAVAQLAKRAAVAHERQVPHRRPLPPRMCLARPFDRARRRYVIADE